MSESNNTVKSHGFGLLLIPTLTVFISSACIMIIELVASRLIARHLGSSLYTWTAVIGVVLAGITIGNYIGGRLGDRYRPRRALAVIFTLCSMACVLTVILNNLVGEWIWLWKLSWPTRVFSHVSLVFLLPSTLLGTISPVVAKSALDLGLQTGRTVGNIYAWGAAGSIAGTFLAGYYLIAAFGTTAIIWTVAGILLVMGLLYWLRFIPGYACLVIFIFAALLGNGSWQWTQSAGAAMALREKPDPRQIYAAETPYCYVRVNRVSENPDKRSFLQDKLLHSQINMDAPLDLQYFYTTIYARVTDWLTQSKKSPVNAMIIGGGGYVFPRYLAETRPNSRVDVIEIDPGVTKAAYEAFGLSYDTPINSVVMDARYCVDQLLRYPGFENLADTYDFIYEDAINDYSVPFQLVTREFTESINKILHQNGAYMVNMIDIYDHGLFLGAMLNTLESIFPHVSVIAERMPSSVRNTFVLIATKEPLGLDDLKQATQDELDIDFWFLDDSELQILRDKNGHLELSDDFAPVDNLLAPVVRQSALDLLGQRLMDEAEMATEQGNYTEALRKYESAVEYVPHLAVKIYNEMAMVHARQNDLEGSVIWFRKALEASKASTLTSDMGNIHHSLGTALMQLGKTQDALQEYTQAIAAYEKRIETTNPLKRYKNLILLGDARAETGDFSNAAKSFAAAVDLNPSDPENQQKLVKSLELAGQLSQAIQAAQNAVNYFRSQNEENLARSFEQMRDYLRYQQSQQK